MTQQKRNKRRLLETEDSETRASQSYSKFLILLFSLDSQSSETIASAWTNTTSFPPFLCCLLCWKKHRPTWQMNFFAAQVHISYYILGKFSADPELLIWSVIYEDKIVLAGKIAVGWSNCDNSTDSDEWFCNLIAGAAPAYYSLRVPMLGFAQHRKGERRAHTWRVLVAGEDPAKGTTMLLDQQQRTPGVGQRRRSASCGREKERASTQGERGTGEEKATTLDLWCCLEGP
jgi:hypothetical protein